MCPKASRKARGPGDGSGGGLTRIRYLDKPFLDLLTDNTKFEYKQTNLGVQDRHLEVFTPPKGGKEGFDVVFDLTGETSAEKPEIVRSPFILPPSSAFAPIP